MECKDCFVGGNEGKKEEEERKTNYLFYLLIFLGVTLAAWTAMDFLAPEKPAQLDPIYLQAASAAPTPAVAFGSSGQVANTGQNRKIFEQQAATAGSECGDLNDPQNLQHLSHHPDQFQECYNLVDPQKFKSAVGRDVSEFMR